MENQNNKPRIAVARDTARKLLSEAGIIDPPIFIKEVVEYLERFHDLSIFAWNFGDDIDGIQVTKEQSATIGYNKTQHQHRQRFTIAHEIGHFLLGHTSKNYDFNLKSKKPKEIEANQFAAELLMPLKMLKQDFENGIKNAKDIAKRYNVSEEAVWWRLYDCKLINKI